MSASLYDEFKKEKAPEPERIDEQFVDASSLFFTICKKCGSKISKRLIRCPECEKPNKDYVPRPMED